MGLTLRLICFLYSYM